MITTPPPTMRELHSRSADGIQVRLLWNERDDATIVAYAAARA